MQQKFLPAHLKGSSQVGRLHQNYDDDDDSTAIKLRETGASGGLLYAWQ
jgi:hypothetical protein